MKIYNLLRPKAGEPHNFNLLPYFSFYWSEEQQYLNIGWLHICFQFKVK